MEWTKTERFINGAAAHSSVVQAHLEELTFEMLAKAEEGLVEHHFDGDAQVLRERPRGGLYDDLDWYIILSDERGLKAALSIEYGHGEYTRTVRTKDGQEYEITVPASQPTYILTNATRLPRKGKRVTGDIP